MRDSRRNTKARITARGFVRSTRSESRSSRESSGGKTEEAAELLSGVNAAVNVWRVSCRTTPKQQRKPIGGARHSQHAGKVRTKADGAMEHSARRGVNHRTSPFFFLTESGGCLTFQ